MVFLRLFRVFRHFCDEFRVTIEIKEDEGNAENDEQNGGKLRGREEGNPRIAARIIAQVFDRKSPYAVSDERVRDDDARNGAADELVQPYDMFFVFEKEMPDEKIKEQKADDAADQLAQESHAAPIPYAAF